MRLAPAILYVATCAACSPIIPDTVDPLARNWEVVEAKVADNRWRLALRKKYITTGGDGEAIMLLHRHAERLAETQGYRSYLILHWQEGVQSDMPLAHRWARGEVELREYMPPIPEGDLPGTSS